MKFKKLKDLDGIPELHFYECDEPIIKGMESRFLGGPREINIADELSAMHADDYFPKMKDHYKSQLPEECRVIVISTAHSHAERLVFAAMVCLDSNGEPTMARLPIVIGGEHTMMSHGGDYSTMHEDAHYLQKLVELNK